MKLLTKTNRIYLTFSTAIYLFAGLAFYQVIKILIYDEVENRLKVEKRDFEQYLKIHDNWSSGYFVENKIEVSPVTGPIQAAEFFTDTLMRSRYEDELTPFRQLTFYATIGGVVREVTIRKSLIQTFRLIEIITATMVVCLVLLLIGTFWFQGKSSGRIWHPFYETLSRMKNFDLTHEKPLQLDKPEIDEFEELNEVFRKMGEKMQHDYRSLKEFTENASHEIQTPLALINAKVEQLIQHAKLSETQTHLIEDIYQASRRMARLNQGLLLLAKIENHQFTTNHTINLTELLVNKLGDMEEMIHYKQLEVQLENDTPFVVELPPALAETLVNNLVNNAIKHNHAQGQIRLHSTPEQICLSNTGHALISPPERLFERFKKEGTGPDSVGLGLAIIKEICTNYNLQINYTVGDGWHQFCISS